LRHTCFAQSCCWMFKRVIGKHKLGIVNCKTASKDVKSRRAECRLATLEKLIKMPLWKVHPLTKLVSFGGISLKIKTGITRPLQFLASGLVLLQQSRTGTGTTMEINFRASMCHPRLLMNFNAWHRVLVHILNQNGQIKSMNHCWIQDEFIIDVEPLRRERPGDSATGPC
jgi:hypothetical protein